MRNDLYTALSDVLPECKLIPEVYDGYRNARSGTFELFMESAKDLKHLEDYKLIPMSSVRFPIPKKSYEGVEICGKKLEEVGCGILSLAQGMARSSEIVSRETIIDLARVIEEKGYYYPGRGLYWHIFKYFAGYHPVHWYEIVMAIQSGCPVTVLLNIPGKERRLFTNLVGMKNLIIEQNAGRYMPVYHPDDFVFFTSEGERITLGELMKSGFLETDPWVWPITTK